MWLTGLKDPRVFLGPEAISFTELSTLAHCEKKWDLGYNIEEREKSDPTPAMARGSEMHRLLNIWWDGDSDRWDESQDETATWLMERYHEHYRAEAAPLKMLQTDVPFAVEWEGTWLFGWFDGLVLDMSTGELWIAEFKTMGNWKRLNQLPKDKQILFYILAAQSMGMTVAGVMFDAILTEHWKGVEGEVFKSGPRKGEPKPFHPPADSFDRRWEVRSEDDIDEFKAELSAAIDARYGLRIRAWNPIRNVGQACDWCYAMPECFGISLELLDEEF